MTTDAVHAATPPAGGRRIEHRPLADLPAHPRNPKAHDLGLINSSVGRFGYIEPIVLDERTGQIISGHGRTDTLRAMEAAGQQPPDGITVDDQGRWLAPVVVGWSSRSDAEANAAVIALNRTTEVGGWVDETLLDLLDDLADIEGGLDGVGYGEAEIADLRARLAALDENPQPGAAGPSRPLRAPAEGPGSVRLYHGDNLAVMAALPEASIDAVVCDPPYGIDFMGRQWDDLGAPAEFAGWCQTWAEQCLRLLKPGGHLIAFGATRTHHRLAQGIEDAGFQIRDCGVWLYRSGFPKSANMTEPMTRWLAGEPVAQAELKRIAEDVYRVTGYLKAARDAAGWNNKRIDALFGTTGMAGHWTSQASQPQVPSLRQWQILKTELGMADDVDHLVERFAATERPDDWGQGDGQQERFLQGLHDGEVPGGPQVWGTALKPSIEPWVLARKPPVGNTAQNVQTYGTGALNIEACRAAMTEEDRENFARGSEAWHKMALDRGTGNKPADVYGVYGITDPSEAATAGRWPANAITGEDDEDLRFFRYTGGQIADYPKAAAAEKPWADDGTTSASWNPRCAVCGGYSVSERNPCTCETFTPADDPQEGDGQIHPTVKPLALMRHLVTLVTPPGGTVLDPFAGTGTTGEAAVVDGFDAVLIEREEGYLPLIKTRLDVEPSPLPD